MPEQINNGEGQRKQTGLKVANTKKGKPGEKEYFTHACPARAKL